MRQADFERRHRAEWQRFERWLQTRGAARRRAVPATAGPSDADAGAIGSEAAANAIALDDAAMPAAFRRLCAQLALAADRHYSPDLVDYLNGLALRGHHVLYAARARRGHTLLGFALATFPRRLRAEWRAFALAALLFFGPFLGLIAAIQVWPELASLLLSPLEMARVQEMYDPANVVLGPRPADDNVAMFGYYVWNNVRIGFQTFAGGVAFGLGTLFFLLYNGLMLGAVAGHLTEAGLGPQLWSFVAGHSAMELTAIAVAGAAGFKLGHALLAPGRRSRRAALVEDGRIAVELIAGAALMFLVAAAIEAFWSPINLADPRPKYAIGIGLWLLVAAWLGLAGRNRGA